MRRRRREEHAYFSKMTPNQLDALRAQLEEQLRRDLVAFGRIDEHVSAIYQQLTAHERKLQVLHKQPEYSVGGIWGLINTGIHALNGSGRAEHKRMMEIITKLRRVLRPLDMPFGEHLPIDDEARNVIVKRHVSNEQIEADTLRKVLVAQRLLEIEIVVARRKLKLIEEALPKARRRKRAQHHAEAARILNVKNRRGSAKLASKLERTAACPYCGRPLGANAEVDHIVPVDKGGRTTLENLVYVCSACNRKKGNQALVRFLEENHYDMHRTFAVLRSLGKDY